MKTLAQVHDEWVAAVAARDCTTSLAEFYRQYRRAFLLEQAEQEGKPKQVKATGQPAQFRLDDFLATHKPKVAGGTGRQ